MQGEKKKNQIARSMLSKAGWGWLLGYDTKNKNYNKEFIPPAPQQSARRQEKKGLMMIQERRRIERNGKKDD